MTYGESQRVRGLDVHLRRLEALGRAGREAIPGVVAETALLGVAEIQKIITNEIAPHNRDGRTVTDLVDTGHYRANWQAREVGLAHWRISTNTPYAPALEYGFTREIPRRDGGVTVVRTRPNFVVRRSKIRIRNILRDRVRRAINRVSGR